ncbi:ABC transporter substrate-binding protein [Pseudorhodoferax sp.]|uniref:ABC transporter substrate-binding protein n=1 Tax=Pseudorhodoferax sp. TaxID=1993553 RepID=UPI002DD658D2|nr:ABC transporter substrate-binding protein [Pseudorhodoferax sp.]
MHSKTRRLITLAALAMALPALAQKQYDPGASDTEIRLGLPMPYSGPAAGYSIQGRVAMAYFNKLNDEGGINGRKVKVVSYDDEYSPPKTVEVVRRMVEQDEVLAVFGLMGTATNAAVQRYLNAKKVPQLYIASGATRFNDPRGNAYTVPFIPSLTSEGKSFGRHIVQTLPQAKVAVLYQNDDLGRDLLAGLKTGMGDAAKSQIVAQASYELSDPTVDSQMVQLKASGANVFVSLSTAKHAAQAIRKAHEMDWKPELQYLSLVAAFVKTTFEPAGLDASKGIISLAYFKDAGQARWNSDAQTQEYKAFMARYAPKEDIRNASGVYGYIVAQTMAQTLRQAGDNLTRANLLKQATSLGQYSPSMMLPGLAIQLAPGDYTPLRKVQPVRFDGVELAPFGAPVAME